MVWKPMSLTLPSMKAPKLSVFLRHRLWKTSAIQAAVILVGEG